MLNPESKEQYRAARNQGSLAVSYDQSRRDSGRSASSWQDPATTVLAPETPPTAFLVAVARNSTNSVLGQISGQISQVINGMSVATQQAVGTTLANAMVSWMTNSGGSLLSLMFLN